MYTIGEFSTIGKVTTKMLRHYDKIDLLKPMYVNPQNGYRYYTKEQVQTILLINKLKQYEFSLKEIGYLLEHQQTEVWKKQIKEKTLQMDAKIQEQKFLLEQLQKDLKKLEQGGNWMKSERKFDVKVTEEKEKEVISIRKTISMEDIGNVIGKGMEIAFQKGLRPVGPVTTIYYDSEFDPEYTDLEICVPVDRKVEGVTRTFGGFTCASTTFVGVYSEIGEAYAFLTDWMKEHQYQLVHAPFESYRKGHEAGVSPEEFETVVFFPIGN